MTYLKWIYARWGQVFCFASGALLLGNGSEYGGDMRKVVAGIAFLATGLALRQQMIWRDDRNS